MDCGVLGDEMFASVNKLLKGGLQFRSGAVQVLMPRNGVSDWQLMPSCDSLTCLHCEIPLSQSKGSDVQQKAIVKHLAGKMKVKKGEFPGGACCWDRLLMQCCTVVVGRGG